MMRLGAALLSMGALACGGSAELVVVVESDLQQVELIRAVVNDQSGRPRSLNDFRLDEIALPFSFGVVPIDGDPERTIEIELSAYDEARTLLVSTRARTGFTANRTLRLPMFLAETCLDLMCSAEETCSKEGCLSPDVSPEMLSEIEPGKEI